MIKIDPTHEPLVFVGISVFAFHIHITKKLQAGQMGKRYCSYNVGITSHVSKKKHKKQQCAPNQFRSKQVRIVTVLKSKIEAQLPIFIDLSSAKWAFASNLR